MFSQRRLKEIFHKSILQVREDPAIFLFNARRYLITAVPRKTQYLYLRTRSYSRRFIKYIVRSSIHSLITFPKYVITSSIHASLEERFPVWRRDSQSGREILGNEDFIVVTASDESHHQTLMKFLCSVYEYIPESRVIVFDLGLSDATRRKLSKWFEWVELRKFDFSKYPHFFKERFQGKLGYYAWKPVIVADVMHEFKHPLIWMDAGTLICSRLDQVREVMNSTGFYIRKGRYPISRFIHYKTREHMGVSDDLLDMPEYQGDFVGVNYSNPKVRDLIDRWKEYALIKECIAPEGSNRRNHRHDQAILTALVYEYWSDLGMHDRMVLGKDEKGYKHHYDVDFWTVMFH